MYHDLRNKFQAARTTHIQNESIRQDLEQQLAAMTADLHEVITRLQNENDALEEDNDRLSELLEGMPSNGDLEVQLTQMKAWDVSLSPGSISFVDHDFLDPVPFLQMGILKPGQRAHCPAVTH
jgi:hypothetical protein